MNSSWDCIESGALSAQAAMEKEARLLQALRSDGPALLHFYEWASPCLTYGHFIEPHRHLNLEYLDAYGLHIAKRPTGGGITFHLHDFAFSLLLPANHPRFSVNTLDNYALINQIVAEAIAPITHTPTLLAEEPTGHDAACTSFCLAKPTRYDLMVAGKKTGGAAQRRCKQGLLHQMSLCLIFPPESLLKHLLKHPETVLNAMRQYSSALLAPHTPETKLPCIRTEIKARLQRFFMHL